MPLDYNSASIDHYLSTHAVVNNHFVSAHLHTLVNHRWLKKYGILTESEHKMRNQQEDIIKGNVVAEYLPFLFTDENGTTIQKTPCLSVKNLYAKIEQQLDGYKR